MELSHSVDRPGTWLALFASMGTLICCALPIVLVSLGLGAVVASVTFRFPFLVTLSDYSVLMFGGTFVLLALAAWIAFFRPLQCPADPVLANSCRQARSWNQRIWWLSTGLWLLGFSARFVLPAIRNLLS